MTTAKKTKANEESKVAILSFPKPDDWKNIVRDLKLTTTQERELEITSRHVLADIESYQAVKSKAPPRHIFVAALKRLEKALDRVQSEMESGGHLMNQYLPSNTLEFIGASFTFSAIGQAIAADVFPGDHDFAIQKMIERNNFISMADLEKHFYNDRVALGYKYGGEILKHFIDVIHADLNTWVELERRNQGGRPADISRKYIIRRLAEMSPKIIGESATTTAQGKFAELCIAVLPACGFSSEGIEKAIEAVLGRTNVGKREERRKHRGNSE